VLLAGMPSEARILGAVQQERQARPPSLYRQDRT